MRFKQLPLIIMLLLLWSHTAAAQTAINVGDLPAGQQVVVTVNVRVNEELPPGILFLNTQGEVAGANFGTVQTDDPDTSESSDPTRTQVGFYLAVDELPSTGQTPLWRITLISAVIALIVTGIAYTIMRRKFSI